mmetsp:Transcript_24748/g.42653  ORF Transcript_24748/g.42653 Transcript_24748/m.42653 type:complete len:281 (-) Transcript_24748:119-961(-)
MCFWKEHFWISERRRSSPRSTPGSRRRSSPLEKRAKFILASASRRRRARRSSSRHIFQKVLFLGRVLLPQAKQPRVPQSKHRHNHARFLPEHACWHVHGHAPFDSHSPCLLCPPVAGRAAPLSHLFSNTFLFASFSKRHQVMKAWCTATYPHTAPKPGQVLIAELLEERGAARRCTDCTLSRSSSLQYHVSALSGDMTGMIFIRCCFAEGSKSWIALRLARSSRAIRLDMRKQMLMVLTRKVKVGTAKQATQLTVGCFAALLALELMIRNKYGTAGARCI